MTPPAFTAAENFLTAITTNMQSTIADVHAAEARLSDAAPVPATTEKTDG